jgi:predicted kinase
VREGHGDLRAEYVLIDGTVRVVDCVEFDPYLRCSDVSDDLAFLVSDLAARGGARWGRVLVHAYRQAGGDPGDDELIGFYAAHRALVRAKVAYVRSAQLAADSEKHQRSVACGRSLIELAERFAWQARLPLALVVCGVPASGKTSLAQEVARASGLARLSSDPIRKQLAGIPTGQRGADDIYGREWNARTYAELGRRAGQAVRTEGGAIVDATFRHGDDRETFAQSFAAAAPVVFVECRAPGSVLRARAAERDRDPTRISDANRAIVEREQSSWVALDELPADAMCCCAPTAR